MTGGLQSGSRVLKTGDLSLQLGPRGIGWIRHGDLVVLRAIELTARDADWGTSPSTSSEWQVKRRNQGLRASLQTEFDLGGVTLRSITSVEAYASGFLRCSVAMTPLGDAAVNRVGLIVLHPMDVAGHAMTVHGQNIVSTRFPKDIAPWPIVSGFTELRWRPARTVEAELRLTGDVWEMEDQRQWTDASFKSYPRPLREPYPFTLRAGAIVEQEVVVTLNTRTRPSRTVQADPHVAFRVGRHRRMPRIGLWSASDELVLRPESANRLRRLEPSHLRVHVSTSEIDWRSRLASSANIAAEVGADLEVDVTVDDASYQRDLGGLWRVILATSCATTWVNIFSASSPTGFDTTKVLAQRGLPALRALGYGGRIGVGSRANYTEAIRAGLESRGLPAVTFTVNPQIHAFDDESVIETLRTLPVVLRDARRKFGNVPMSIGVSLRPRVNPYATGAAGDPPERPSLDPRQASAFAAAWTVGALQGLSTAQQLTLFETAGPAGVLGQAADSGSAQDPQGLYPVFGVIAAFQSLEGCVPIDVSETPRTLPTIAATAVAHRSGWRILVSNLSSAPQRVALAGLPSGIPEVHTLARDPVADLEALWSVSRSRVTSRGGRLRLDLDPNEVARLDWVSTA